MRDVEKAYIELLELLRPYPDLLEIVSRAETKAQKQNMIDWIESEVFRKIDIVH